MPLVITRGLHFSICALILSAGAAGAQSARVQGWIDKKSHRVPLVCPDGCGPSLALLRTVDEEPRTAADVAENDDRCLATLISPDTLLTNSHCVPKPNLLKYTRVMFPATAGFKAESRRLVGVVARDDLKLNPLLDYAILKMDRTVQRPAIKINAHGASSDQPVSVYAFDERPTVRSALAGLFEKRTCVIAASNGVPNDARNVTLTLQGCVIRNGDSGGPILDAAGELIGIVWGSTSTHSVGVDARCIPSLPNHVNCVQSAQSLAGRTATWAQDEMYFALREYFEVHAHGEDRGDERRMVQEVKCFESTPEAPVKIEGRAITFARPAPGTYVPLNTKISYRSEPIIYAFEPRGPAAVWLSVTLGAETTERLVSRCR